MNNKILDQVTVVIPTLSNAKGLVKLVDELGKIGIQIVVVDNQPTSDKKAWAKEQKIKYLPQNENMGFAAGVNLGAEQVKSKWLIIANDDVESVTKKVVNSMLKTAENNKWDAISPILINKDGKIENVGYKVLPIGKVELNFDTEKNTSEHLDGLTAAFLLIKRGVFQNVGGFDESFFAYLEDVDLFLTLKENGYAFGVDTEVEVIHNHMTTSSKERGFKEKQDLRNWWRIYKKHTSISFSIKYFLERGRNLAGIVKINYMKNV